jgi:hypothetical protein
VKAGLMLADDVKTQDVKRLVRRAPTHIPVLVCYKKEEV